MATKDVYVSTPHRVVNRSGREWIFDRVLLRSDRRTRRGDPAAAQPRYQPIVQRII